MSIQQGEGRMNIETRFDETVSACRAIFEKKLSAYGPTWLLFRWPSLIDQLWIKLKRLRTLEESTGSRLVEDTPADEYRGLINYCLIGLMKAGGTLPSPEDALESPSLVLDGDPMEYLRAYDAAAAEARALLARKNHDYGDAWRGMAVESVTDQMLIKALRLKHILQKHRDVPEADGIAAQLSDILNYSVFSLILREDNP